jgi:hypothetical protein
VGTSFLATGLTVDQVLYAKVATVNASGTGIDSEPVGARVAPGSFSPLLIVNGFDRRDRNVKEQENPRDWIRFQGAAASSISSAGYPFDGATNDAIANGAVLLQSYRCVGWFLGEESSADESFSALEQFRVNAYLSSGGHFFFSGSEVGWDLDFLGNPSDRLFYEQSLGQDFVSDDASTYGVQPTSTGPLAPLPAMTFDNGSAGIYNVDYPDVVQPSIAGAGTVVLRYSTGAGAAVLHGNGRVLGLGFPMETIVNTGHRAQLMERVLQLMCPLPVRPIGPVVQGTTLQVALSFPGESNRPYFAAASLANAPGIPLPGGKTVPLAMDDLFWFSLSSQPIFVDMIATAEMIAAVEAWEPTLSDVFSAEVIMIPTMNEYFEQWKNSVYVTGTEGAEETAFVGVSRLFDINGILTGLHTAYLELSPAVAAVDDDLDSQILSGFDELVSFVADLFQQEQDGVIFTPEEADLFGTEAQDQATALAGQVAQAAALLNVELVE